MNASLHKMSVSAHWTVQEAFLGVLTLTALVDGHNASKRLEAVHAFAARSPFLAPLGEKGIVQLHSDVCARMSEAGEGALSEACALLPRHMRASVYAACADILAATGAYLASDRRALDELRGLLSIDPAHAGEIESVLLLKNKF